MWILCDSRIPVISQEYIFVRMRWSNGSVVSRQLVKSRNVTTLRHGIAISGISRMRNHIEIITEGELLPVGISDAIDSPKIGRIGPGTVILHSSIYIVWDFIIHIDVVKLAHRNSFSEVSGFTHVTGDIQSPIISIDLKGRVVGIDIPHA